LGLGVVNVLAGLPMLPLATGMSGGLYAMAAPWPNVVFIGHAWRPYGDYNVTRARRTFAWSIPYLCLLFAALRLDHWLNGRLT